MDERFPYGYDAEAYVEKAIEKMKETYPWTTRELFNPSYSYVIEESEGKRDYVTYYRWKNGETDRTVCTGNADDFIASVISNQSFTIECANDPVSVFEVPLKGGRNLGGWNLESYVFLKLELGGYAATVTAGDRSAGGSRTFYIPPAYFELPYEQFLDRYCELVPPWQFGLDKEDLLQVEGLKEFLGFAD